MVKYREYPGAGGEISPSSVDFYVMLALKNNSRKSGEEIYKEVKGEMPGVGKGDIDKAMNRVHGIVERYTAIVDPLFGGFIPFYAFINVRENFKFVTDSIRGNIKKAVGGEDGTIISVYDLIGKPDFLIIGLTKGAHGKKAEQFVHRFLSDVGGGRIHNYLTTQVEIPRSIKKFWHSELDITDFNECSREVAKARDKMDELDNAILRELQKNCRRSTEELSNVLKAEASIINGRIKALEDRKIIRGYSTVIDPKDYPSRHWNFIKAFIQVDSLYDKFDELYVMLKKDYSKEIRGLIQIPYSRYGVLVECETADIAGLSKIMGSIRNQDYVRTTRTAIARDVVWESLQVI